MLRFTFKKRADFRDVNRAFRDFDQAVDEAVDTVGQDSVEYAKASGEYHDVTGNLRASNEYEVVNHGLRLVNTAEYASDVEARGENVLGYAALYAEGMLKQQFEGQP